MKVGRSYIGRRAVKKFLAQGGDVFVAGYGGKVVEVSLFLPDAKRGRPYGAGNSWMACDGCSQDRLLATALSILSARDGYWLEIYGRKERA